MVSKNIDDVVFSVLAVRLECGAKLLWITQKDDLEK